MRVALHGFTLSVPGLDNVNPTLFSSSKNDVCSCHPVLVRCFYSRYYLLTKPIYSPCITRMGEQFLHVYSTRLSEPARGAYNSWIRSWKKCNRIDLFKASQFWSHISARQPLLLETDLGALL